MHFVLAYKIGHLHHHKQAPPDTIRRGSLIQDSGLLPTPEHKHYRLLYAKAGVKAVG